MRFRFLLSDPSGAVELSPQFLQQPFLMNPGEKHPFLTLKDYFEAIAEYITMDDGRLLRTTVGMAHHSAGGSVSPAGISEVAICSEKHGAFYHIASIVFVGSGGPEKFVVVTALSEPARRSLQEEFHIMQRLAAMEPAYMPELYRMETIPWRTDRGVEEFVMVLGEWLTGYHEWHVSLDPEDDRHKIQLWDYEREFRFLSEDESFELVRRAACILTTYYDQKSFKQIYPWHHGAGDFIVKAEPGTISVRLITARQYEPLVHFDRADDSDRLVAAIHFLLNLSVRMRLDRLDGVGAPAWLDDFAVPAAVAGFFDGLAAGAEAGRNMIGPIADFLAVFQSFEAEELFEMYESLLAIYGEEDEDDFRLIRAMLPEHCRQLHAALQRFSLVKT